MIYAQALAVAVLVFVAIVNAYVSGRSDGLKKWNDLQQTPFESVADETKRRRWGR